MKFAKFLYAMLFVIFVPVLLALWAKAASHNVAMPVYGGPVIGWLFVASGSALMFLGMHALWRYGGGLPMNAFPPPRFVSSGVFRFLPHPIYTGFVAICLGVSMAAKSPSGLWLVTPSVALGCIALVLGFERPDLQRRFGHALRVLPVDDDEAPTTLERVQSLLLAVVPWLALYEFTVHLPAKGFAFSFPFEQRLPIYPWSILLYESTYVTVALAPWCAQTRRNLRKFMISAWAATLVGFCFYWFLPSAAPRRPLAGPGWLTQLLLWERSTYPATAAFPSFHVLWSVLVARLYRPRWLGFAYGAAVAISCVTTGMHYISDVLLALALAPMLLEPQRPWELLRRLAERLANSWREWRIGPFRIINHGFFAAIAAFVQAQIVLAAMSPGREWKALVTLAAGLLGSGAWAQWVEGSSRLRRPFGFYGGLLGVLISCLFFEERWTLLAAHCVAAPWMQAIGRLRCLVNGCCHGRPASPAVGIRVTHERSRIARLADLADVPIHPTQLYSILGNIVLGLLLARLWASGCPTALICGIYAIGNGLARFIEEAYRGEPQTPRVLGLPLYQWVATATVFIGALLSTFASPEPPSLSFTPIGSALALAFAFVAATALSVDLPESNRPLARLT
jgi:protein-S-isoprenylcysteine O-methyltransferase Ste14